MADRVLAVGQGYVGLPLAMAAVEAGFDVTGFDTDHRKVAGLNAGTSHVEDVPAARVGDAADLGRYRAVADIDDLEVFDVAVISVPTPLADGAPDLSFIEQAAHTLAPLVRPGCTVILESTTYPGTTEELVAPILEQGSGLTAGVDFWLGYSPERIDPGNRTWTFETTPKVVAGVGEASLAKVQGFFDRLIDHTVPVSSVKVAELTKLLENTFRHVNIALVNELAMFAHDLDIDVWEAIDAASAKPFGYMRFTPGPGVGGHCLPVDPSYLSWQVRQRLGESFRFVELANDVNEHMPDYVVRRLTHALNDRELPVRGRRILALGLAYKANTGDARESPAVQVVRRLVDLGAEVHVADPHIDPARRPDGVTLVDPTEAEVTAADAVVLLVDHDAFDLATVADQASYVLDTKHVMSGGSVEHL